MSKTPTYLANLLQTCIDKKLHISGKLIHAHILRHGLFADTFLSNRLIELYNKCNKINTARHLFDQMPLKNIYSCNAMLGAYCKSNKLEDAHVLFDEMPERNTVSWNTLISALVKNGMMGEALGVYCRMKWEGFVPTHFTLASVVSACGMARDVEGGRGEHCVAIKIGLDENVYVGNALLSMYAKCGCVGDAVKAFEDLGEPNEVSFTAMMGVLAETDQVEEALKMFRWMFRIGISVDSISLSCVLGVFSRSGIGNTKGLLGNAHGRLIHALIIRLGFENDLHLGNSLLDMYAKTRDMESAEAVFTYLPEVSIVSLNVMIGGYGQDYQIDKALEYMQMMKRYGFEADEVTHVNMLAACIKSGDVETARKIFSNMACPSLASWNAMLSGYFQNEKFKEAIKLFREMQFRNVQADRTTLAIILNSCAVLGLFEWGKSVHCTSIKGLNHTDIYVGSGLIGLYSKCNQVDVAKSIFDRIQDRDVVCWNSMIAGLSLNSLDKEAFNLFKQMIGKGLYPTQFSYATILSSCAKSSSVPQGRQIHAQIVKEGGVNDVYVGSALIDMYSKCGEVHEARIFFDTMPFRNTITWNEMIHGYAQNGCGNEAIDLYDEMIQSGEKLDGITFLAVLTACSHSGLVDHGVAVFNSMQSDHGEEPLSDHYTCMIDTLGRAGRFHEIEVLVDKMPCKDDPIVWEVLLSSCRLHDNVSLARRAADALFSLDPKNSAPYVLLANMYSSLGRWDEVKDVRDMMSKKSIVKNQGYSWLEQKSEKQQCIVDHYRYVEMHDFEAVCNTSLC
ncbi:pentatricopeptide repeat-containing protein At4g20770-like [Apium graveolens]|uniref:pentatricopeptide repeat-containing protein At4g20770-like n=1 Tax=Apium graveolens TaxID=4045 RepID=UPI003D7B2DC7